MVRAYGEEYLGQTPTSVQQRRALTDIAACRTPALGGHVYECDECGQRKTSGNPCGNRHCPQCQGAARAQWLEKRLLDLLPVVYFHVVFTLPHLLGPLALQNPRVVYGILFRAVAETLLELGETRRAARFGFLAVLHTWGQSVEHHAHLHTVVPSGGIALDDSRWVRLKGKRFFLPARVLRHLFRAKVLDYLRQAFLGGELEFHGRIEHLADEGEFRCLLAATKRKAWVVHAKPPFGGPQTALGYLARYTHRVAISNERLLSIKDGRVCFAYKDYSQQSRPREMTLDANEFLRRYLLHVLPRGFVRIRYYGFLANCHRRQKLARARELLATPAPEATPPNGARVLVHRCRRCGRGRMLLVATFDAELPATVIVFDSS